MDVSFCQQCGGYIAPEKVVLVQVGTGGGAAFCPACRGLYGWRPVNHHSGGDSKCDARVSFDSGRPNVHRGAHLKCESGFVFDKRRWK